MRLTQAQKDLRMHARNYGKWTRIAIDAARSWSREADKAGDDLDGLRATCYRASAEQHAENAVSYARRAAHFALEALR
jgi:hypothetical protein